MASELGIEIGSTMEELDDFLLKEGWQPDIGTLAKIAQWNKWVKLRFFSNGSLSKKSFINRLVYYKAKALREINAWVLNLVSR